MPEHPHMTKFGDPLPRVRERTRSALRRNLWILKLPFYLACWALIGFGAYVAGLPSLLDVLITLIGTGVTMNYLDRPLRRR